jgi:hypothetical protein
MSVIQIQIPARDIALTCISSGSATSDIRHLPPLVVGCRPLYDDLTNVNFLLRIQLCFPNIFSIGVLGFRRTPHLLSSSSGLDFSLLGVGGQPLRRYSVHTAIASLMAYLYIFLFHLMLSRTYDSVG